MGYYIAVIVWSLASGGYVITSSFRDELVRAAGQIRSSLVARSAPVLAGRHATSSETA